MGYGSGSNESPATTCPARVGFLVGFILVVVFMWGGVDCLGCINFDSARMRASLNFDLQLAPAIELGYNFGGDFCKKNI